MVKVITISTWITFMCLCYLAVKNGLDLFTGIALITNIVSNVINMIYLLKERSDSVPVGKPTPQTIATKKYEKKLVGCQNLIN